MPLKILYPYSTDRHEELEKGAINIKINSITQAIGDNSDTNLEALLLSDHVYSDSRPEFMQVQVGTQWGVGPSGMMMLQPRYETQRTGNYLYQYSARPLLEAIYVDRPDDFYKLVLTLTQSHNQKLQDAFMRAWNKMRV